jgi:ABC-2 type transport system permease protein
VIFSGFFFGGDAISSEFQNKTGYFLLTNPVKRSSVYMGKWFAAVIASATILGAYSVIDVADTIYHFGLPAFSPQFGEAMLFSMLYLIAVLGFTFFISSALKSSSVSIIVTAVLLIFGFTVIEEFCYAIAHVEPWFLITYGSEIITNVLAIPYPAHTVTVLSTTALELAGGKTFTEYTATVAEGIVILTVYFVATMILGLVMFGKRQFN